MIWQVHHLVCFAALCLSFIVAGVRGEGSYTRPSRIFRRVDHVDVYKVLFDRKHAPDHTFVGYAIFIKPNTLLLPAHDKGQVRRELSSWPLNSDEELPIIFARGSSLFGTAAPGDIKKITTFLNSQPHMPAFQKSPVREAESEHFVENTQSWVDRNLKALSGIKLIHRKGFGDHPSRRESPDSKGSTGLQKEHGEKLSPSRQTSYKTISSHAENEQTGQQKSSNSGSDPHDPEQRRYPEHDKDLQSMKSFKSIQENSRPPSQATLRWGEVKLESPGWQPGSTKTNPEAAGTSLQRPSPKKPGCWGKFKDFCL